MCSDSAIDLARLATANQGTTADLLGRAGHVNPAAALLYQHAVPDRDKVLADALVMLAGAGAGEPIGETAKSSVPGCHADDRLGLPGRELRTTPLQ